MLFSFGFAFQFIFLGLKLEKEFADSASGWAQWRGMLFFLVFRINP